MKSPVWYSAKLQLSVIAVVTCVLAIYGKVLAYSFALGGIVYILPNLYFVHYAFRYSGSDHAPLIARSFSWGESGKLALTAFGFVVVYRFVDPLHTLSLFAGFCSMIVLQWFVAAHIARATDLKNSN